MEKLELKLIGNLEVRHKGGSLPLPPSRKTRALLAYLALNNRSFPREFLCELLWEIPDDPRGSLRWSLSKIRKLINHDGIESVIADRSTVRLDVANISVDVLHLRQCASDGASMGVDQLTAAIEAYSGNFLEGLELSNFHTFHAWCISQREEVNRLQVSLLERLVVLLQDTPQQALPWARQLVARSPYDEDARAGLISLLVNQGLAREAEQQYRLGLRQLKEIGKNESPVMFNAWRGLPPAAPDSASRKEKPVERVSDPTIFGRKAESERLAAFTSGASNAKVIMLSGAPGLGKSRLLQSVVEGDNDCLFIRARTFESEMHRPFAIWLDALRELNPTHALLEPDTGDREQLFHGLSRVFNAAAEERPIVLLLDDLHWCDESSATALHYIMRSSSSRPLRAIIAVRPDEMRDNTPLNRVVREMKKDELLKEVRLSPLAETDIEALIRASFPDAPAAQLAARCSGNPLLALEFAMAEESGSISESLGDLVSERMRRFDVDGEEILQWCALFISRISEDDIVAVADLDRQLVGEVLQQAEKEGLMTAGFNDYRFSHDLLAKGIYAGIPPARRKVMHRRVAECMEQRASLALDDAADMAYHASQSGDAALAARAMIAAGRLCLRYFANDDAQALARQGLSWAEELAGPDSVNIAIELHEVLLSAAPVENWEAMINEYTRLAERALDQGSIGHARIGYHMASYLKWVHGEWSGAREETLQAERVTRGGTEEEHIAGLAETAKCLAMIERDLSQADAMLMEAESLARRQKISHLAIPAGLGMIRYHENKLDEAEDLFQEARTLCRAAGDRINEFLTLEYLAMIEFERGEYERMLGVCDALRGLGARVREGSEGPFSEALTALCRYYINEGDDVLEPTLESLRIADAKHRLAYVLNRAALRDLEIGRIESAGHRAGEALQYADLLQRHSESLLAHHVLSRTSSGKERKTHQAAVDKLIERPVAEWSRHRVKEGI